MYKNARDSKISNSGEDVLGARRHAFDTYESLKDASSYKSIINQSRKIMQRESQSNVCRLTYVKSYILTTSKYLDDSNVTLDYLLDLVRSIRLSSTIEDIKKDFRSTIRQRREEFGRYDDYANYLAVLSKRMSNVRFYATPRIDHLRSRNVNVKLEVVSNLSDEKFLSLFEEAAKKGSSKRVKRGVTRLDSIKQIVDAAFKESLLTHSVTVTQDLDIDSYRKFKNLRAIQWGNSMPDPERAYHLSHAHATLVNIETLVPQSVAVMQNLSLAFGARGKAGAAAHYEPIKKIINMTRKNGYGSLAHEMGHFLDYELGVLGSEGMGQVLRQEEGRLREALKDTDYMLNIKYWVDHREIIARAFEVLYKAEFPSDTYGCLVGFGTVYPEVASPIVQKLRQVLCGSVSFRNVC